eukprot:TRINITY_DN3333_c0_g1_i1.p1 TRINITY_DN3333_c0_g1~~TRINITY_DN3333_c0_g1_i1.p1  ORF type:complete len:297 (+),score=82.42 TRINITY_DN3333_c0_g1_i1:38-928(+)
MEEDIPHFPTEEGPSKRPRVNSETLQQLEDMGYPRERSLKALVMCGGTTAEVAVSWLLEHAEDPEIDAPFEVEPEIFTKVPLTEEEKKRKLDELQERVRIKREQDKEAERKAEQERERKRVEQGKEMQRIKEERERQDRLSMENAKRRQKEEEAKARAKVQEQLRKDRIERFGYEKAMEIEERERKEKEEGSALREQFKAIFLALKAAHPAEAKKAAETLLVYLNNALEHPKEDKYLHIKKTNAAFQSRVGSLEGGIEFLLLAGFENNGDMLDLNDHNAKLLHAAVTELKVQLLYL